MFRSLRTSSSMTASDAQAGLAAALAFHPVVERARAEDGSVDGRDESDAQREREALHRSGTELEKDQARQQRRDVGIDDGRESLAIPEIERRVGRLSSS